MKWKLALAAASYLLAAILSPQVALDPRATAWGDPLTYAWLLAGISLAAAAALFGFLILMRWRRR